MDCKQCCLLHPKPSLFLYGLFVLLVFFYLKVRFVKNIQDWILGNALRSAPLDKSKVISCSVKIIQNTATPVSVLISITCWTLALFVLFRLHCGVISILLSSSDQFTLALEAYYNFTFINVFDEIFLYIRRNILITEDNAFTYIFFYKN